MKGQIPVAKQLCLVRSPKDYGCETEITTQAKMKRKVKAGSPLLHSKAQLVQHSSLPCGSTLPHGLWQQETLVPKAYRLFSVSCSDPGLLWRAACSFLPSWRYMRSLCIREGDCPACLVKESLRWGQQQDKQRHRASVSLTSGLRWATSAPGKATASWSPQTHNMVPQGSMEHILGNIPSHQDFCSDFFPPEGRHLSAINLPCCL